jgi:DNA-binding CsgD family transcriptional regulator
LESAHDAVPDRPGQAPVLIEPLTPREHDVLVLVADGLRNREVAERLGITEHTVKFHLAAIFGKLGASSRTEAVRRGFQLGLIQL